MNKKANWTLPAILGLAGIIMFLDAIRIEQFLPANRFFEGFLGIVFLVVAILTHNIRS